VILVWMLVVMVNEIPIKEAPIYFSNAYVCAEMARLIESGRRTGHSGRQKGLTAYCLPKRVGEQTEVWRNTKFAP